MTSAWNGEREHNFIGGGGGVEGEGGGGGEGEGGRGATEHEEFGEHHPRRVRHQRQPHQHRDGSPPHGDHQHQHQQGGNTPERRSGRGDGGVLTAHFGDVVGGRPRSGGILGGVQSPPPTRTPVDGGDEHDAHWEASTGIGTLRRGKSAGTFFLQQQHQHGGGGGGVDVGRATGAGGEERNHQAGNNTGGRDSPSKGNGSSSLFDSPGRALNGRGNHDNDGYVIGSGPHAEDDHQTVSVLTAATSLTQNSAIDGTIPPTLGQQQQRDPGERRGNVGENHHQRPGSSQRQENEESARRVDAGRGGASAPACRGLSTPPHHMSGQPTSTINGVGVAAGQAGGLHSSPATKSAGAMTPPAPAPAPAPATSIKEMQGRARIQHTPKTVCDVVVTAAGESSTESPQTSRQGGRASAAAVRGGSAKTTSRVGGEEGGRGAKDGKEVADVVATDETATAGDESDGGGDDSKHQRQQRALRAFLQGVSVLTERNF